MKLLNVVLFLFFTTVISLNAKCTNIVAGKKATVDGSILNSHTGAAPECRVHYVPAQTFDKGSMVPCYYGDLEVKKPFKTYGEVIGYIPQVEKTFAYFHSAYSHINEHQLCISESTTNVRKELLTEREKGAKQIITVEQVEIFALQRCKTARDAINVIAKILEKYGFLPSLFGEAETICISDPSEIWIMELLPVGNDWEPESGEPGVIWAAQRVPDEHIAVVPNWSIIKEIDISNTNEFRASSNYKSFAIKKGWFDQNGSMPFIWQEVYSATPREWSTGRFWLFLKTFAPNYTNLPDRDLTNPYKGIDDYHQFVEPLSMYPFSVKPEKLLTPKDIMDFQRSVFEGTIYDMTSDPDWYVLNDNGEMELSPLATPFPTKPMRQLLDINHRRPVSRGGYGMVAQLRSWMPDEVGGVYWLYMDNQYVSAYLPVHTGNTKFHKAYHIYDPDNYNEKSIYWAVDLIDNLLYLRWQDAAEDMKKLRNKFEEELFQDLEQTEREALKIDDPEKRKKYVTEKAINRVENAMSVYKNIQKVLISKYTNNKQGL